MNEDRLTVIEAKQTQQEKIKIYQAIVVMIFVFLVVIMDVI